MWCVCGVCNDLGDPPGHLTLPPVATYADEASSCAIWPATTAWIAMPSPHTQTQFCTMLHARHFVQALIHNIVVQKHTQTTVKSDKEQAVGSQSKIDLSSSMLKKTSE